MHPNDPIPGSADLPSVRVNALGMKCPWPVLRAARAMRDADAILIAADDPMAARELAALARQHGWTLQTMDPTHFLLSRS